MLRRTFLELMCGSAPMLKWSASSAFGKLPFEVVDVMSAFWRFWNMTIHAAPDERVRAFFDQVVGAYPELFQHGLIASGPLTDHESDPEAQSRVAKYLSDIVPLLPAMRHITTVLQDNFSGYAENFRRMFTDYAPATPVYFTVSILGFSAGMLGSEDSSALYFGVDQLARLYGPEVSIKVIVQHELFHQYHYQIAPALYMDREAWAFLWEEGVATYVSRKLNPGTTVDGALVAPPRLYELAKPHLTEVAKQLLAIAESANPDDYMKFFLDGQPSFQIPPRMGYVVGYLVAERLATTRSHMELAHLQSNELKAAVLDALVAISTRK